MRDLLIIGSGHYVTGQTVLTGRETTDKDFGVILPSAFYLRSIGRINNITVCGTNGEKLARIKESTSWPQGMDSLDTSFDFFPSESSIDEYAYIKALNSAKRDCAVIIAVPDYLHTQVMLECSKRDLSFLIVKPAVSTLEDFYKISDSLASTTLAMVDYHKVYDEANLMIRADLQSGRLGRVQSVSSLMTQRRTMLDIYKGAIERDSNLNINHYLGSHYIHMTSFLTGASPIDVRSTQQFGYAKSQLELDVADVIETHIRWKDNSGHEFSSFHVAGWNDPKTTESMTFQELHLLCQEGHIFSDQRYRGYRRISTDRGIEAPNPYFFNLDPDLVGACNLSGKYGFKSIAMFLDMLDRGYNHWSKAFIPTFRESEKVTAILEAADISLRNDSRVVNIEEDNGRLTLKM